MTTSKPVSLYTFNWTSGGYNSVYAKTKAEARKEIARKFKGCGLDVDPKSFRRLSTQSSIRNYWKNLPFFD